MALPNIFAKSVADEIIDRINKLQLDTHPTWGTTNVDQMLAHFNVANNFAGKVSLSFSKLNKVEWSIMMHKHLDHHLIQFGV